MSAQKDRPSKKRSIEKIGPYSFIQEGAGQKVTGDSLLLADFIHPLKEDAAVIDLGTGTGVIPLVLAYRSPVKKIVGVEVDEGAAAIARKNVEMNGLGKRISILRRDWRDLKTLYPEGSFSVVLSNPPYVRKGSGRVSPAKERAAARSEVYGSFGDLIEVSKYLVGDDGRIFYIFTVTRLFEMLDEVRSAGLKPLRLKFIHTSPKKAARLFLIEAGREGEFIIDMPLFI